MARYEAETGRLPPTDAPPIRFMGSVLARMNADIREESWQSRMKAWGWYNRYIRYAAESLIWLKTQDRKVIPFRANRIQRMFLAKVTWDWYVRGVPIRYVIGPKPRRIGMTTVTEIFSHLVAKFTPHYPALCVAHNAKVTELIFRWHRLFEDYINAKCRDDAHRAGKPTEWREHFAYVPLIRKNEYVISWQDYIGLDEKGKSMWATEGGSEIKIATGGNVKGALGDAFGLIGYHEIGVDDVDWDAVTTANDIMVPNIDEYGNPAVGTFIFKEGATYLDDTSRITAGVFLETEVKKAREGVSGYEHLFYPWFEHDRYRLRLPEGMTLVTATGSGAEKNRKAEKISEIRGIMWEAWGIDRARGSYRDRLIRTTEEALHYWQEILFPKEAKGDFDWLSSQFPTTWHEAFVSRGQRYFAVRVLNDQIERLARAYDPAERAADPELEGIPQPRIVSPRLVVYRDPVPDVKYIVPSDHASGAAEDATTAWAFNTTDLTIDAVWQAYDAETPEQTAEIVDELCWRYAYTTWRDGALVTLESALWVPEANVFGGECIRIAWDEKKFRSIWRRKPLDPKAGKQERGSLGFWTSPDKRWDALGHLKDQWQTWGIFDPRILRQMANFGYRKGVKTGQIPSAVTGNDDFVTIGWIQAYVNRVLGYARGPDWRTFHQKDVKALTADLGVTNTIAALEDALAKARTDAARGIEGAFARSADLERTLGEANAIRARETAAKEPNRAWQRMMNGTLSPRGDRRTAGLSRTTHRWRKT